MAHTVHAKRYEFVMALRDRMPELSVYGRGINPIDEKSEAMDDYRYHLAIENIGQKSSQIVSSPIVYHFTLATLITQRPSLETPSSQSISIISVKPKRLSAELSLKTPTKNVYPTS